MTETNKLDYQRVDSRQYETPDTSGEGNTAHEYTQGQEYQQVTMNTDQTVDFLNTKKLVGTPTGLERNDTPYTILVTAAGIAGLALIGGIVARRRRRRME